MDDLPLPILLVDDHAKLARLVIELLTRLGYPEVDEAREGGEALTMLGRKQYGLVISDLDMKPVDGMQLLKAIRADKALAAIPVIITESGFTFEQVNAAHHMGADAFLLKPYDLALFKSKLKSVTSRSRRRERPGRASTTGLGLAS